MNALHCTICAAYGTVTTGEPLTEIAYDATRDRLPSRTVYACDACIAAGTDADREQMAVTAEEWAAIQRRRAERASLA